MSSVKQAQPSH